MKLNEVKRPNYLSRKYKLISSTLVPMNSRYVVSQTWTPNSDKNANVAACHLRLCKMLQEPNHDTFSVSYGHCLC